MRTLAAVLPLVALVLACGSFGASDDPTTAPPPAPDGGAPTTEAGDASLCEGPIFVAPSGDDARRGCDQAAPMKSVAAAVSRGKEIGAHEIRICSGVYDEHALTLDSPISLHGGYDCATWQRTGAETGIIRTGPSSNATTLLVSGAAVSHDVEIDGLAIDGPAEGTTGTAVAIADGAKPFLHDLRITGGATAATSGTAGAFGVDIRSGSAPEITNSVISGGLGTAQLGANEIGTVAVRVVGSTPWLHDLAIDGGKTKSVEQGIQIVAGSTLVGANALSKVHVSWSSGDSIAVGIVIGDANTQVEIVDSTIDMVEIACSVANKSCVMEGIASRQAHVTVRRTKILGSNLHEGTGPSNLIGITANGGDLDVENSFVFGGNDPPTSTVAVTAFLVTGTSTKLLYNTIGLTGLATNGTAVRIVGAATDVVIDGNLFLAANGYIVDLSQCDGSSVRSFFGNAIVGAPVIAMIRVQCGTIPMLTEASSVKDAESALGLVPSNNHRYGVACTSSEERCTMLAPCDGNGDCTAAIFTGGRATRASLAQDGWKLAAGAPCTIAKPAYTDSAAESTVTTDFSGATRTKPFSVGASETETCTLP